MEPIYKPCTRCKVVLERNSENFGINRAVPDGYDYYCKGCQVVKRKKQRRKHKQVYCSTGIVELGIDESVYYKRNCVICEKEFFPKIKAHVRCLDCSGIAREIVHHGLSGSRKIKGEYCHQKVSSDVVNEVTRKYVLAESCAYCGRSFTKENPKSLDHIVPVVKGGKNETSNINICCLECNMRKRDSTLQDWIALCSLVVKHMT